ncbi:hypothetical protein J3R30DRAFT_829810 [Lentinula aciculospora]|uniref:Uncharacterized protein n=1 Tax=Lentinula aciculospora TaxID=153920 RepID=A0A9W9APR0_9AGAR|nr:hypothetical protein J3R30DRAFT_829810 [Lentinula aciculospora]
MSLPEEYSFASFSIPLTTSSTFLTLTDFLLHHSFQPPYRLIFQCSCFLFLLYSSSIFFNTSLRTLCLPYHTNRTTHSTRASTCFNPSLTNSSVLRNVVFVCSFSNINALDIDSMAESSAAFSIGSIEGGANLNGTMRKYNPDDTEGL